MLTGTYEIRGPGYFWKVLERKFGDTIKNAARGMRMCSDNKVCTVYEWREKNIGIIDVCSYDYYNTFRLCCSI